MGHHPLAAISDGRRRISTHSNYAMDEYIDIVDGNGKPTGQSVLKSMAHQKGLLHATVHIWFYTQKGELLFQRRAATKKTFPSLWDVSVAGHIAAGETVEKAALREVEEEIGLPIKDNDLAAVGTSTSVHRHPNGIVDAEFNHCFLVELKVGITTLKLQEDEVEAVQLIAYETLKKRLEDGPTDDFVPIPKTYWTRLFTKLEDLLK